MYEKEIALKCLKAGKSIQYFDIIFEKKSMKKRDILFLDGIECCQFDESYLKELPMLLSTVQWNFNSNEQTNKKPSNHFIALLIKAHTGRFQFLLRIIRA